ncbi:MAG: hypothetical protein GY756_00995 [bacterium]|nr:hypothetical protein [bacterium]
MPSINKHNKDIIPMGEEFLKTIKWNKKGIYLIGEEHDRNYGYILLAILSNILLKEQSQSKINIFFEGYPWNKGNYLNDYLKKDLKLLFPILYREFEFTCNFITKNIINNKNVFFYGIETEGSRPFQCYTGCTNRKILSIRQNKYRIKPRIKIKKLPEISFAELLMADSDWLAIKDNRLNSVTNKDWAEKVLKKAKPNEYNIVVIGRDHVPMFHNHELITKRCTGILAPLVRQVMKYNFIHNNSVERKVVVIDATKTKPMHFHGLHANCIFKKLEHTDLTSHSIRAFEDNLKYYIGKIGSLHWNL